MDVRSAKRIALARVTDRDPLKLVSLHFEPDANRAVVEFGSDPLLDATPPVRLHVEVPRRGDKPTRDDVAAIGWSALAALLRHWAAEAEHRARSKEFEESFTAAFNDASHSHKILKFGIESTRLLQDHKLLRAAVPDPTARFIRFLPDSVLVGLKGGSTAALLEFKQANTRLTNRVFDLIRRQHDKLHQDEPAVKDKEDLFPIDKVKLDAYQQLDRSGIRVVVLGWQAWRDADAADLRAQYAERIVTCHVYEAQRPGKSTIANVHFGGFVPIQEFFEQEFGIPPEVTAAVAATTAASVPTPGKG